LYVPDNNQVNPNFEQRGFPLTGAFNAGGIFTPDLLNTTLFPSLNTLGEGNLFHFQKDTTAESVLQSLNNQVPPTGFSETEDYLFSGAMVVPLDIQIQALLYAQERSFFVIPGYSFNQNPNDTRTNWILTNSRPIYDSFETSTLNKDVFPFYNEPMDVKITIDGAITENYTASAGDQAAWMCRWGYIPTAQGSATTCFIPDQHIGTQTPLEAQEHIARGLTFIYDPSLPLPYQNAQDVNLMDVTQAAVTLRQQRAMRYNYINTAGTFFATPGNAVFQTLPSVPKLPVCPGLLYFGPPDSPVVQ
jgi:hypothetical protein